MIDPLLLPFAEAAKSCYDADAKFCWEGEDKTSHLMQTTINGVLTFVFKGTLPDIQEWGLDLFALPVPIPDVPQVGDLHAGMALGACCAVYQYILPTLASLGYPPYYLDGHSKGAGQAGQAHGILKAIGHGPLATRMYEPPFFGGQKLVDLMGNDDVEWTETYNTHRSDIVTHVPIGLSWRRNKPPIRLKVPDDATIVTMHIMSTICTSIQELITTSTAT